MCIKYRTPHKNMCVKYCTPHNNIMCVKYHTPHKNMCVYNTVHHDYNQSSSEFKKSANRKQELFSEQIRYMHKQESP